jgi:hypothetical protein
MDTNIGPLKPDVAWPHPRKPNLQLLNPTLDFNTQLYYRVKECDVVTTHFDLQNVTATVFSPFFADWALDMINIIIIKVHILNTRVFNTYMCNYYTNMGPDHKILFQVINNNYSKGNHCYLLH